jgi:hypothetical protein
VAINGPQFEVMYATEAGAVLIHFFPTLPRPDPRHFSLLGPFGDLKSIVGTALYSRLSALMEGEGCTDN